MIPDDILLSYDDFINNYEAIYVFIKGMTTTSSFKAYSFKTPYAKKKPVPYNKEIKVKYFHASPLWLHNIYSNNLN